MMHKVAGDGPIARVAVYWDFENLFISQYNLIHNANGQKSAWYDDRRLGTAAIKDKAQAAAIDLDALLAVAAALGPIVVNRTYCDWTRKILSGYGQDFARRRVELVQQFSVDSGKNGADIRIALDVVEDLTLDPAITDVVLFSGDGDFVSVANHCHRNRVAIHAVGVRERSQKFWQKSCNFRFYDEAVAAAPALDAVRREATERIDALDLVTQSLQRVPVGCAIPRDQLESMMRRISWSFDVTASGYGTIDALVDAATEAQLLSVGHDGKLRATPRTISTDSPSNGESGTSATDLVEIAINLTPPEPPPAMSTRPGVPADSRPPRLRRCARRAGLGVLVAGTAVLTHLTERHLRGRSDA